MEKIEDRDIEEIFRDTDLFSKCFMNEYTWLVLKHWSSLTKLRTTFLSTLIGSNSENSFFCVCVRVCSAAALQRARAVAPLLISRAVAGRVKERNEQKETTGAAGTVTRTEVVGN